jgi:hypothetical protein
MKHQPSPADSPSSPTQLVAAMQALGQYTGENSPAEHAAEVKRLGSADYYQALLANALLGMVEVDAMHCDGLGLSAERLRAAHEQANASAGAEDDPAMLLRVLRWRTLRVEGPLREIAQHVEAGPIPLAAAHAAEGLQRLLGVCAEGQNLASADPTRMQADLEAAREALSNALANIDIMFDLIAQVERLL